MQITEALQTAENCRYCLMCRHVCPVGHITQIETLTPHGWGLIIASVIRGLLNWDEKSVDLLYSCADCGACRANCVNDQPLPSAIATFRAEVVRQNLAPRTVTTIREALEVWSNPYSELTPKPVVNRTNIGLFVGDKTAHLAPKTLDAALTLLHALGLEVSLIANGRNNGYIPSSIGLLDSGYALAEATIRELETIQARQLFVLTAEDYFTITKLYKERLGITFPESVQVIILISFLVEKLASGELHLAQSRDLRPYSYIDATHSVRIPGYGEAPRQLLKAIMPGEKKELFWRNDHAHPFGSTALQFTQPSLSERLTRSRLIDAQRSGGQLIILEDPGDIHQANLYAWEYGLEVCGLYELMAEHLS